LGAGALVDWLIDLLVDWLTGGLRKISLIDVTL
jgi:hypothetical protein